MTTPQWPERRPVSAEELAAERRRSLTLAPKEFWDDEPPSFTCDECDHAKGCALAFDHYSTFGACLADK